MSDLVHEWTQDGVVVTFTWLGDVDIAPDRVYALAFAPEQKMLLVTDEKWKPKGWLPGGGIEANETPEEALERELLEEANAVIHERERLGIQHAKDSLGRVAHQAFYWCRITGNPQFGRNEQEVEPILVNVADFLDTLFWGRADPKGAMLLERASQLQQEYETANSPHH